MAKAANKTTKNERLSFRPDRRVCSEVMVSQDAWLCVCVLPPLHDGAHLPSPYLAVEQ